MCKLVHEALNSRVVTQIMQSRVKMKASAVPTAMCDMHAKGQCSDLIIATVAT